MRIIGIIAILGLSACSVANNTARHGGTGFTNGTAAVNAPVAPAAEGDYRGKLMEEIAAG